LLLNLLAVVLVLHAYGLAYSEDPLPGAEQPLASNPQSAEKTRMEIQKRGVGEKATKMVYTENAEVGRTTTVLLVAHRLSTVVGADRILVLAGGRVRAAGTHAELLATDELYQRLAAGQLVGTAHVQ